MKKMFAIVALVLLIWYGRASYTHDLRVKNPATQRVIVHIEPGASVKAIGKALEEKKIIPSARSFRWYVWGNGFRKKLQAGSFAFLPGTTIKDAVEAIIGEGQREIAVTFPEGITVQDMDEILAKKGIFPHGELVKCMVECAIPDALKKLGIPDDATLEGYLFPDTYFIDPLASTAESFAMRMVNNFLRRLGDELIQNIQKNPASLHDIVVMASIVEKEVRTDPDYPIVAGILWKRLRAGWPLGADAAILYIKPDKKIQAADWDLDTPYNTRKFKGLPPTAIGNPGLKALRAAVQPQQSPYWFYLMPPNGDHVVYSTTNEEHNENRRKYLQP